MANIRSTATRSAASRNLFSARRSNPCYSKQKSRVSTGSSSISSGKAFQGDFNGDGNQDIVLLGGAGEVWTALSNGDGTFGAPISVNLLALACSLCDGATDDVDKDGKFDMAVAYPGDAAFGGGGTNPSGYLVFKGNGDGTFETPTLYPAGEEIVSVKLADMNSDGVLDLFLNDLPA